MVRKGEVELSYESPSKQEFKLHIVGPCSFLNDGCYFENEKSNLHSARVISLKCSVFSIKKFNFDRIVKENKEIQLNLQS